MLFFNLKLLEEQCSNNPKKLITMLFHWYIKDIPTKDNKLDFSKVPLIGNSYIINPEPIFKDKSSDIIYLSQYVKLVGMRDYTIYKQYGDKSLHLSYYPDIHLDNIKHNPLLKITKHKILFKYEELN